ncbi:MAG: hypothetical protein MHPSP_002971, partial [Paramarteilia canceri]
HYFTSILKLIYYLINHDDCLNLFLAFFETTDIDWNNGQVHVEKVELLANIFIKSIMKSTQNCQEYSVVALNNWISEMLSMKSPLALGVIDN